MPMSGKIARLLISIVITVAITGPILSTPAGAVVSVAEIRITKTSDSPIITTGETATFTITVTNMGGQEITNIIVSDPLTPGCDGNYSYLQPGAVFSYSCETNPLTNDLTNTATVWADAGFDPLMDSDVAMVEVVSPVVITKLPLTQTVENGAAAAFTITVENIGTQTLTDPEVSDPLSPGCDRVLRDLGPGASATYTCQSDPVTTDFVNTATVTATYNSLSVEDSDTAIVDLPGGGGGGGCNTTGPAPGEPIWPEMVWLVLLGGILIVMRRRSLKN